MPEEPPKWREYDAPGDEPGEKIQPEPPELDKPLTLYPPGMAPPVQQPGAWAGPRTSKVGMGIGLSIAAVAVLIVVGAAGLVVFAVSGGSDSAGGIDMPGGRPDMHSQAGLDELADELRDAYGTTDLYSLTLYPDYAVGKVAIEGGRGDRYEGFYFDGGVDKDWGGKGTSDVEPFALSEVDGSQLPEMCAAAKDQVEDPGECYFILDEDFGVADATFYRVYATNEFGEGGYIQYDRKGKEVNRTTW